MRKLWPRPLRSLVKQLQKELTADDLDSLRILTAQAGLRSRRPVREDYRFLHDAELQVFSQWGEDGILDLLCDALELSKPSVVEFGAGNFRECNSRFLAENRSASVVAIDARSDLASNIESSPLRWRTNIHALQQWVSPSNAREVFAEAKRLLGGGPPDILSLDFDGVDYWILERLDLDGVSIVVIEYNPLFGAERAVSVPMADTFDRRTAHHSWLYFGASLRAWIELLGQRGFAFVGSNRQGNNAFFVTSAPANKIPVVPVDLGKLAQFVQWNVRESRDPSGALSYLTGDARVNSMADMPVVDVRTGESLTVGEL